MVLSNGISILVHQPEIGNGMVFLHAEGCCPPPVLTSLGWYTLSVLFLGKALGKLQNDDGREYQHDDSKEFVFLAKRISAFEILNKGTASKKKNHKSSNS